MKRMTMKLSKHFIYSKCQKNIGLAVDQEERLCHEKEMVKNCTYPGDRINSSGIYR